MPLFYLHLNECGEITQAEEGIESVGLSEIRKEALKGAREIMCAEIVTGHLCLTCRIDIADATGAIVLTVPFGDAVRVTGLSSV